MSLYNYFYKFTLLFCIFLVCSFNLNAQLNGSYTINSSQSTSGRNFQSFIDLTDTLNAVGVSDSVQVDVVVGSGPYIGRVIFGNYSGVSASNKIIINGNGETIQFNPDFNQRYIIDLNSSKHITLDSFLITGSTSYHGYAIRFNNADSCSIKNSKVILQSGSGAGSGAVLIKNSNSIVIEHDSIVGGMLAGVIIDRSSHCLIAYNSIENYQAGIRRGIFIGNNGGFSVYQSNKVIGNTIRDFYGDGIYASGQDDLLILQNDISSSISRTPSSNSLIGIKLRGKMGNMAIRKNRIHDLLVDNTNPYNKIIGIRCETENEPMNNVVSNNLIYNLRSKIAGIYGIYNYGSNRVDFIHNTIALDDDSAQTGNTYGYLHEESIGLDTSVLIKNNIFSISRSGTGNKYGISFLDATSVQKCDFNNIHMNSQGGTQHIGFFNGNKSSRSDWRAANSGTFGQNSVFSNPFFTGFNNGKPSSIEADESGLDLGVLDDLYSIARDSTPDIGAIEFDPPLIDDMGVVSLLSPINRHQDSCFFTNEHLLIRLKNEGNTPIDLSNTPLIVNVTINGPISRNFTHTINSNSSNNGIPLLTSETTDVLIDSVDLSQNGIYQFQIIIDLINDTIEFNDTLNFALTNAFPRPHLTGLDTICNGDSLYLKATNIGNPNLLKWQIFSNGWIDLTGISGKSYSFIPTKSESFRVKVCDNVFSDSLHVALRVNKPTAVGDSTIVNCGDTATVFGHVIGAANSQFYWYDSLFAGNPIVKGKEIDFSQKSDTIFYTNSPSINNLQQKIDVFVSKREKIGLQPTLAITEIDMNNIDMIEIQNVSQSTLNVNGWKVLVSNSYANINSVNSVVKVLSGSMSSGQIHYWTDGASNPWGSNINFHPGNPGWVAILDSSGSIVDFVAMEWSSINLSNMSAKIQGDTIEPYIDRSWIGDGIPTSSLSNGFTLNRTGHIDNNNSINFLSDSTTSGNQNNNISIPFIRDFCESYREKVELFIGCITSIKDVHFEKNNILIYPNPASKSLNLKTPFSYHLIEYKIFSMEGKEIQYGIINSEENSTIDISSLSSGLYIIEVITDNNSFHKEKILIR